MATTWLAAVALATLIGAPIETPITHVPSHLYARGAESAWTPISTRTAPARWRSQICAGVSGVSEGNAQFVIDRVSQRASEVGLRVGAPGCTSNILVVFTTDPNGQAQAIASERSDPASTTGASGDTAGLEALGRFLNSENAVRWWRVTRTMTETGEMADRNVRAGEAPRVLVPERGRLGSPTNSVMSHVIVVVDLRQVNGVNLGALSDYVALVALAPIEPGEGPQASSVLTLFADRAAGREPVNALTESDRTYLAQIYR